MPSAPENPAQKPARAVRRHDPERRERIITAALDTIAENGVAEATLRRVAAAADVPLGSISYHFSGREELLFEAFSRFSGEMVLDLETSLSNARTPRQVKTAIVEHICGPAWAVRRNLLLSYELYAYSSRQKGSTQVWLNWIARVRAILLRHFDKRTADAIDALIEGYIIHRSIDQEPPTKRDIQAVIDKLTS
ncbi:TPA: TetR family transcriptional regulator [Citrobacter farmeri]|uniref:TetR family transcriptional regulator n=1 Tax=Citrobacter farmeri TaxID=67824 RepID=A0A8H9NQY3_9ENTR|nr:TetR family transcriptional regulator [Citrobacter farmeri]NTY15637.1 TetR family transcriptional regulator [Citrobacter farmeri]HAT1583725.1 TetR family transcriptional regulator [Citrobacter farmeri]HCB1455854.1 TetR family transcriptional regulator [Citrobacter farmeri]HCB1606593.1 TetR family transcriptional regulator [Citrobacter farmeri]